MRTGNVSIESVGAVCDRPLRADDIRPYEMGREMSDRIRRGERCERCQRQMKRAERVAAVDKIEHPSRCDDFIGHRNKKNSHWSLYFD